MISYNDCEEGSDRMLDNLSNADEIIHLRNDGPYDDRGIRFAAQKIRLLPKGRERGRLDHASGYR